MTDETFSEGNSADGGQNAKSDASPTQSQPLDAGLSKAIANLQKKLDEQDGEIRALKGGKDRAVDRAVKSNEETLAKLAKYLDVEPAQIQKAQRDSVLDDLIAERMGTSQSQAPISGRGGTRDAETDSRAIDSFTVADAISEVESFELSPNEQSFIDLLRKNPDKQQVRDYILERKKPHQPPSPVGFTQAPAVGAPISPETSALLAQLSALQKTPTQNRDKIKELTTELDKRGWK